MPEKSWPDDCFASPPWHVRLDGEFGVVCTDQGVIVVNSLPAWAAHLIAAAPLMLETLELLCDAVDALHTDETIYMEDEMLKARNALAAARGGEG